MKGRTNFNRENPGNMSFELNSKLNKKYSKTKHIPGQEV